MDPRERPDGPLEFKMELERKLKDVRQVGLPGMLIIVPSRNLKIIMVNRVLSVQSPTNRVTEELWNELEGVVFQFEAFDAPLRNAREAKDDEGNEVLHELSPVDPSHFPRVP